MTMSATTATTTRQRIKSDSQNVDTCSVYLVQSDLYVDVPDDVVALDGAVPLGLAVAQSEAATVFTQELL